MSEERDNQRLSARVVVCVCVCLCVCVCCVWVVWCVRLRVMIVSLFTERLRHERTHERNNERQCGCECMKELDERVRETETERKREIRKVRRREIEIAGARLNESVCERDLGSSSQT